MGSWLFPSRLLEATPEQVIVTGAAGGAWGTDAGDPGERGWRPAGSAGRREVPWWTQEKSRIYSVASYRANPMARAIVDTYTTFCVGDSGVKTQVTSPQVQPIVDEFWDDPKNDLPNGQELALRSMMLMGEKLYQLLTGPASGAVRFLPIDPTFITNVLLVGSNPLWPGYLSFSPGGTEADGKALQVVTVDDTTGLRTGEAMFWRPWRALDTDVRSMPFLSPILDALDSYDTVLSNLIDRTSLARYLVWDVTVSGGQAQVDEFVKNRGSDHVPRSGSIEVHNDGVKWEPKTASSGAAEDTQAAASVLTQVAGGAGLAKHWLAEPEQTNKATSNSMAEPVRRRVQGTQRMWLGCQTELVRFAVDRAVAAGRLPAMVDAIDPKTGETTKVRASMAVQVTGPEIAASDAQITATTLMNISTGLMQMVQSGVMTAEAAQVAARKAWEDYMGIPYTADLNKPDANPDDVAQAVDDAATKPPAVPLRAVPGAGGGGA